MAIPRRLIWRGQRGVKAQSAKDKSPLRPQAYPNKNANDVRARRPARVHVTVAILRDGRDSLHSESISPLIPSEIKGLHRVHRCQSPLNACGGAETD